jgi:hypothetical protein
VQSFTSLSHPIVRGAAGGPAPARPGVTAIFFLPGDEPGSIGLSASGGSLRKGPERLQGLLTADAPPALYR